MPGVRFAEPEGAFYLFLSVEGAAMRSHLPTAMIDEIAVGWRPGTAFGPGGEDFMRLCFARSAASLQEAMDRLTGWLKTR